MKALIDFDVLDLGIQDVGGERKAVQKVTARAGARTLTKHIYNAPDSTGAERMKDLQAAMGELAMEAFWWWNT